MDYEPSTEGESEGIPEIFQQLLEAVEEQADDDDDDDDESEEFHGSIEHSPAIFLR